MTRPVALPENRNMQNRRARLGTRWEVFFDIVAAATIIVTVITTLSGSSEPGTHRWGSAALMLAGAGLLAVRRRFPVAAAIGAIIISALALLVPQSAVAVWVLAEVCLFTLPLRRPRTTAVTIALIHSAVLYSGALVAFQVTAWDPLALILPVWTLAVVAFGSALRAQEDYIDAVERQAEASAAARENEVRRHVDAERMRIARDLHDSVANSITVVNLESSNARRHLLDDPERASGSLEVIRTVTRSTMTELSEILAILRDDPSSTDRAMATVANLPRLIEQLHTDERPIRADLAAFERAKLNPAADAALYRVVQEALTNARKHGSGPTEIRATLGADTVDVEIINAISAKPHTSEGGFGLVGLRERVHSAGGRIIIDEDAGRFSVRATLPAYDAETLGGRR